MSPLHLCKPSCDSPALLYLVQNNLLYVATSHLDAATCQVAYQLKLLTTAFFTVTLLKRAIPMRRWLALFVLFLGVVLVQTPSSAGHIAVRPRRCEPPALPPALPHALPRALPLALPPAFHAVHSAAPLCSSTLLRQPPSGLRD